MRPGRLVKPLISRATFRKGVFLLLGGTVLIPYQLLGLGFVQMYADPAVPVPPVSVLLAVTIVIGAIPPFLSAVRALEIAAVRGLLAVPLPEPETDPPWETRWRAATWYVLHLVCGGVVMAAVLFAAPMTVVLIMRGVGVDDGWISGVTLDPFTQAHGVAALLLGVALLLAVGYLVAGAGQLLAVVALSLLGPSSSERIRRLEAEARQLSERNRLARELHDSIGHALTVTTLQASAARQVLRSAPDVAERALSAIEDTGRRAMEDLDYVLGLLREGDDTRPDPGVGGATTDRTRPRDLRDIETLVGEMRDAGLEIDADVKIDHVDVPTAVSREGFRIVQESLTNVVRHSGRPRATLRVRADVEGVGVEVRNPLGPGDMPDSAGDVPGAGGAVPGTGGNVPDAGGAVPDSSSSVPDTGGRGLRGMAERVGVLNGTFRAGSVGDQWIVKAWLPGPHSHSTSSPAAGS